MRVSLANQDEYSIGDGEWRAGLSLGYETETANWFVGVGTSAWVFEDDGSYLLKAGLALYWKFTDTIHGRAEWKHDFIDYRGVLDHGNGETVKIGLGFVF